VLILFPLLANGNFCVLLILLLEITARPLKTKAIEDKSLKQKTVFSDQYVRVNYCHVTNLDVIILIFCIQVNLFSLAMCYCAIVHDMRACVVTTVVGNFQFLCSEPLLHVVYEFFETM
jgi:hypothetical protein